MKTRTVLYADAGKILTDGNTFGKIIYLAEDGSADNFYEISENDYEKIMTQEEEASSPAGDFPV